MLIRFACPRCQKLLKVGDQFAGKTSKCPGCAAPVTVPAFSDAPLDDGSAPVTQQAFSSVPASSPWSGLNGAAQQASAPTPDHFGQLDDAPAPAGAPAAWRGVQGGLRNIRTGTVVQLCGLGIFLVYLLIAFFAGVQVASLASRAPTRSFQRVGERPVAFDDDAAKQAADTAWIMLVVTVLAGLSILACALVGAVLRIVGLARCVGAPAGSGAGGWALGAVLGEIVPYGAAFLGCGLSLFHESLGHLMTLVQIAANIGAMVCFLLFVRQVALALGSPQLQARVVRFTLWLVGSVVGYLGVVCLGVVSLIVLGMGAASPDMRLNVATAGLVGIILIVVLTLLQLIIFGIVVGQYLGLLQFAASEVRRRAPYWQPT